MGIGSFLIGFGCGLIATPAVVVICLAASELMLRRKIRKRVEAYHAAQLAWRRQRVDECIRSFWEWEEKKN